MDVVAVAGTLAGTIVGILGTIFVERIRASDAKRARDEARQQERDDFQRATLLELQEVLGMYVRAVGRVRIHDERVKRETGDWRRTQVLGEVSNDTFETGRRARQLVLRVRDHELRQRFGAFYEAAIRVELLDPRTDPDEQMEVFTERLQELEDRLGEDLGRYI